MELDAQQIIREHLSSDERLIWCGRPKQGILFRAYDATFIPASLLLSLIVVSSAISAIKEPEPFGPFYFPIILFPLALLAFYLLIARFIFDILNRRRTYYGLTEGTAVIVSGRHGQKISLVTIWPYTKVELSEYSDGFGTIRFEPAEGRVWIWQDAIGWPDRKPLKFERIENAKTVYDMIRRAQSGN
jgi:hypothetical protein